MLTVEDIKDYLKILNTDLNLEIEKFGVGKLDLNNLQKKQLVVTSLRNNDFYENRYFGIGQINDYLYCTITIHYTKDYITTQEISNKLFNYLKFEDITNINNHEIYLVELLSDNEDLGSDSEGVYERQFGLKIIYGI